MKAKLNIVLECYSIIPMLEHTRQFKWLVQDTINISNIPKLKIGNSIEFIMINIKKIKLELEDNILKQHKLQFPFTYNDFITFARKLASSLNKVASISWIKNLEYMKDYILAPLMVSSKEVIIGIIILDELILKPILNPTDILESNNYLSQISQIKSANVKHTKDIKEILNGELKSDLLIGILAMDGNKLSAKMKLYIMNCRGYIPPVLISRLPKTITATNCFRKLQA